MSQTKATSSRLRCTRHTAYTGDIDTIITQDQAINVLNVRKLSQHTKGLFSD